MLSTTLMNLPTRADVLAAAARLRGVVRRTEVLPLTDVGSAAGTHIYLKCENLQEGRAFKYRGANNAVLALDPATVQRGVATHSSGNHGVALSLAAKRLGVPAYVVVPRTVSPVKLAAIGEAGAIVEFCDPSVQAREAAVTEILRRTGATLVHPYDDALVMAGQGTAALELAEQVPGLSAVVVPVSGGGLIGGTAVALAGSGVTVVGAEPALANDAALSLRTGELQTTAVHTGFTKADGLRASLSARTFAVLREHVRDIIEVTEDEISDAMDLIAARTGMTIEPSSAVAVAAVLKNADRWRGQSVGVIVTGGNV